MVIKNFNKKRDLEYLKSTFKDLFEYNLGIEIDNKKIKETEKEILLSIGKQNHKVFVLFNDSKKHIGYLEVVIRKVNKIKKVVITKIYINPEERKKGYSKVLLDKAKGYAKKNKIDEINLNTYPINFNIYKSLGFEVSSYWMKLNI